MKFKIKRKFVNILCWFIFDKNHRHRFRYQHLTEFLPKNKVERYNKEIKDNNFLNIINNDSNSIKVLHYSTYKEQCGISVFLDDVIKGLEYNGLNNNSVIPVEQEYMQNLENHLLYLDRVIEYARNFDIFSMQHEYAFWRNKDFYNKVKNKYPLFLNDYEYNQDTFSLVLLDYLINSLINMNKRIIITWHSGFEYILDLFFSDNKLISVDYKSLPFFRFIDNELMNIIVMNKEMPEELKKRNIPTNRVKYIQLPVSDSYYKSSDNMALRELYNIKDTDIVLGTFGFIREDKGTQKIVEILNQLPKNYKFLIAGGKHPLDKTDFVDNLLKLIKKYQLEKRVIITGYIDDNKLNEYIKLINLGIYLSNTKMKYASGAIVGFIANKIPVITSANANFRDLKQDWDCLELCEDVDNQDLIIKKIKELVADKERLEVIQHNCEKFCKTNSFKNFTNIYKEYQKEYTCRKN